TSINSRGARALCSIAATVMSVSVSRTGDSPFMEPPRLVRNAWPLAALDTYGQSQAAGLARSSPGAAVTWVNQPQVPARTASVNNRGRFQASQAVGEPAGTRPRGRGRSPHDGRLDARAFPSLSAWGR